MFVYARSHEYLDEGKKTFLEISIRNMILTNKKRIIDQVCIEHLIDYRDVLHIFCNNK